MIGQKTMPLSTLACATRTRPVSGKRRAATSPSQPPSRLPSALPAIATLETSAAFESVEEEDSQIQFVLLAVGAQGGEDVELGMAVISLERMLDEEKDHAGTLEIRDDKDKKLVGKLIDEHGLSERDAFTFLQRSAMSTRRRMIDVAHEVLAGDATL